VLFQIPCGFIIVPYDFTALHDFIVILFCVNLSTPFYPTSAPLGYSPTKKRAAPGRTSLLSREATRYQSLFV
jgi:hypothetical protein